MVTYLDHSGDREAVDYGNGKLNIDIYQVLAEYGSLVVDEEICQHVQLMSHRHINNILSVNGAFQLNSVEVLIGPNMVIICLVFRVLL